MGHDADLHPTDPPRAAGQYIEALRWHGGIVDHGPPLAWELQPMILPNDTYEASLYLILYIYFVASVDMYIFIWM